MSLYLGLFDNLKGVRDDNGNITYSNVPYDNLKYAKVFRDFNSIFYKTTHGGGNISAMSQNCGVVILSGVSTDRVGDITDAMKLCGDMRYSQILYTVASYQTDLKKLLKKAGFKCFAGSTVRNKRSDNLISVYAFNIR